MREPVVICPGRGGSVAVWPHLQCRALGWKGKQALQDLFPESPAHPAVCGGAALEPEATTMAQGREIQGTARKWGQ